MIIAKIKDMKNYLLNDSMKAIYKFVNSTELERLSYGSYEILDNIKIIVDNFECLKEKKYEGHEKKIEVHVIIDGNALYEYADFNDNSIMVDTQYDENEDVALYTGDARGSFKLDKTMFLVVFPDDIVKYDLYDGKDNITKVIFNIAL